MDDEYWKYLVSPTDPEEELKFLIKRLENSLLKPMEEFEDYEK